MTLTFRVFHAGKPKGLNLTFSEKLSYYSLGFAFIYCLIFLFLEKTTSVHFNGLYGILPSLCLLIHFSSFFIRLNEFENLNGNFNRSFKFGDDAIEFEDIFYQYNNMSDFNIKIVDFYGASTNNYRYGPMYKNGTSNYLSFVIAGEKKDFYFELKTEYFITAIYYHLIDIICNEKLPFQEEYLNLIPKKHKDFVVYRDFVSKLRGENKI